MTKQVDGNTIRYTYKYDGYSFHVDAEVDAVQTHNAQEAIKSAWGVDVSVNDDETVNESGSKEVQSYEEEDFVPRNDPRNDGRGSDNSICKRLSGS